MKSLAIVYRECYNNANLKTATAHEGIQKE